jgi:hydroxymethylbilane synthase
MSIDRVRIATRQSPLAWRQAEHVAEILRRFHDDLTVELVGVSTRGDQVQDRSLASLGGKGLFVKELEQWLLDGSADIAVHSMKDVPADTALPEGLTLPTIVERESPRDAFLSNHYDRPEELPEGAHVGTCSPRRASQLLHALPGREVVELRGNVNTRLAKLEAGQFDAIVLARAGLERLGLDGRIRADLADDLCLPGIGQGALGIECRTADTTIIERLNAIADPVTLACVTAERAVSQRLGGSCLSPIAAYATVADGVLRLRARAGAADGSALVETRAHGEPQRAAAVGATAGQALLDQGADRLIHG